jgi:hypothetical protein
MGAFAALLVAAQALAQGGAVPFAQFAAGTIPGTLRYQVALTGPGGGEMKAKLGALANLEVLAGPNLSQEVSWRGGAPTAVSVLTWVMRATHAGPIGVGPTRVRLDAAEFITDAVHGTAFVGSRMVAEPPARQLEVELSTERVVVGEPLTVAFSLNDPWPGPAWELQASFPESWSERLAQGVPARRPHSAAHVMLGAWVVIPARVGRLQIPAATARPAVSLEDREGSVLPARAITSRATAVDVLPLPAPPVTFTGAVGEFHFSRRLLSNDVVSGDLTELEVEVTGTGNLPLLEPPPLPLPAGGAAFPAEETHEWRATDLGLVGFRRWRCPLEFARAGSYELPAATFCSFRPGHGYATHELPALHLVVRAAAALPPASVAPPTNRGATSGVAPLLVGGAAFLAGIASVLVVLVLRTRRSRSRGVATALAPDTELRDLQLTVESWSRARFGLAVGTGAERLTSAGCPPAEAAEAVFLVQACERLRFSPGLSNPAETLPDLRLRVARLTTSGWASAARLQR